MLKYNELGPLDIENRRLRSIAALELSRESKWQIYKLLNESEVVLIRERQTFSLSLHFWLTVFSGFVWLFVFKIFVERFRYEKRVVKTNEYSWLLNYLDAPFTEFMSNKYSQNGEDGVIREILKRIYGNELNLEEVVVVEFGAWDGMHFSNTFSLVKNKSQAYYIEGDDNRFKKLLETSQFYPNITPIKEYVEPGLGNGSLNSILRRSKCPNEIDVLSIDIDSCDLDIWEQFTYASPKIVVIEINSSIPPGVILRQGKNIGGNSFSATIQVATKKGYSVVHHTGNLILVRNDLLSRMNIPDRYVEFPELLFRSEEIQSFHPKELLKPFRYPRIRKVVLKITFKLISITRFDKVWHRFIALRRTSVNDSPLFCQPIE